MAWFGVVIDKPGEVFDAIGEDLPIGHLYSVGENIASPPFAGSVLVDFGVTKPDFTTHEWNPSTRTLDKRETEDLRDGIQKIFDDADFKSMRLGAPDQQKLRDVLVKLHPDLAKPGSK